MKTGRKRDRGRRRRDRAELRDWREFGADVIAHADMGSGVVCALTASMAFHYILNENEKAVMAARLGWDGRTRSHEDAAL